MDVIRNLNLKKEIKKIKWHREPPVKEFMCPVARLNI